MLFQSATNSFEGRSDEIVTERLGELCAVVSSRLRESPCSIDSKDSRRCLLAGTGPRRSARPSALQERCGSSLRERTSFGFGVGSLVLLLPLDCFFWFVISTRSLGRRLRKVSLSLEGAGVRILLTGSTPGHSDPTLTLRVYAHAMPEDETDPSFTDLHGDKRRHHYWAGLCAHFG